MENNNLGQELAKQTLDQIPQANAKAKRIVGLVKEGGRITGYWLSDSTIAEIISVKAQTASIEGGLLIMIRISR